MRRHSGQRLKLSAQLLFDRETFGRNPVIIVIVQLIP